MKKLIAITIIIITIISFNVTTVFSQTEKQPPKKEPKPLELEEKEEKKKDEDLDLPEVVIYGKDKTKITGEKVLISEDSLQILPIDPLLISKTSDESTSERRTYQQLFAAKDSVLYHSIGYINAAYGNLSSLEGELYYGNYQNRLRYILDLEHKSNEGSVDHSSRRNEFFTGGVSYKTGGNIQLGLMGKWHNKDYQLSPRDTLNSERTMNRFAGEVNAKGKITPFTSFDVSTVIAQNKIDFSESGLDTTFEETEINADFRLLQLLGEQLISLEGNFLHIDATDLGDNQKKTNFLHTKLWGNKSFFTDTFLRKITVQGGLSYNYFSPDTLETVSEIYPFLKLLFNPDINFGELTFSVAYDGELEFYPYYTLFKQNPYAKLSMGNVATETSHRLTSSLNLVYNKNLSFELTYMWENMDDFPVWHEDNSLWNRYYTDIKRNSLIFANTYNLNDELAIVNEIKYQSFSGVPDEIENIPYQADWEANLSLIWDKEDYFNLETELQFVGERYADTITEEKLENYWLLNLMLVKDINKNFNVFARAYNVLNKKYEIWKDYSEPEARILAGVGFNW